MNNKKIALILSLLLSTSAIMPSYSYAAVNNGWSSYNGTWYYYQNGSIKTGWVYDKSNWYYLNSDGRMATGWKYVNGAWYYLNPSGDMATGWKSVNGVWYYLNPSGDMATGWKSVNGVWYYLNPSGSMATGWKNVKGTWYYLESSGAMATGWKTLKGEKYYLNADGSMTIGYKSIGKDSLYYFYESGAMAHDTMIGECNVDSNGLAFRVGAVPKNESIESSMLDFSVASTKEVLSAEDKTINNVYSPASTYMALALLSEGAEGSTKNEILKVLNAPRTSYFSKEVKRTRDKLTKNSADSKCILGNSLWLNSSSAEFEDYYIDDISKEYNAEIFKEKFNGEETPKKISDWISEKTNGKVGTNPKDFKVDESTMMEIINTLYFKDAWREHISKSSTKKKNFTLSDKSKVQSDFMYTTENTYGYKCDDFTSSRLSFKSGNKMLFILPNEGKTPYDILNDKSKLNKALTEVRGKDNKMVDVSFVIPRFKFNSKIDLDKSLKSLGLNEIYSSNADFSKFIMNKQASVSNIKQEAYIGIDEDGAEAAAYTEIGIRESAFLRGEEEKMELKLDRPFIFAIMSEYNIPLFIGVVNNPNL